MLTKRNIYKAKNPNLSMKNQMSSRDFWWLGNLSILFSFLTTRPISGIILLIFGVINYLSFFHIHNLEVRHERIKRKIKQINEKILLESLNEFLSEKEDEAKKPKRKKKK